MSKRVKLQEFTPLANTLKKRFERDQEEIAKRFPRLDAVFLKSFKNKLEEVKLLDKELALSNTQQESSDELYAEADVLSTELTFLSNYLSDAQLDTTAVWSLKKKLIKGNFGDAILKIEGLKQFVMAHQKVLECEGMNACFPEDLEAYKISLTDKNKLHTNDMNKRKPIDPCYKNEYASLSAFIATISYAGKVVFDGTVLKQEYNINKILSKMRTPNKGAFLN